MHKIFISYSRADYTKVVKFKDELEQVLGEGACWIDLAGIESDRQFVDVIIDAIDRAEVFLFMYSKHSDNSEWARKEIEYAYSERKRIVFVKMENIQLSKYFRFQFGGHDIIDMNDRKQKEKLTNNLTKWCGNGSHPQMAVISEEKDRFTYYKEWAGSHFVEALLIISAILVVILFWIGLPLFIGVNYKYRSYLKAKYPQYWNLMLKLRNFTYKMLVAINIGLSFTFVSWAYSDYDNDGLIVAWFLFITSVSFVIYCMRVSYSCCFKKKKTGIFLFSVSAFLYLCAILLFNSNKNVHDYYKTLTPLSEQKDAITPAVYPVEVAEPEIDKKNANSDDSFNVTGNASMQSYCLHGDFDKKESQLQVTVESRRIEGHIEQTATHPELFLSMHLNKKAISGVVENQDGTNIGYVEGLCEINDSTLYIKGKIVLDNGDYNYSDHNFLYMGIVPPSFLDKLQRR